MWGSEPNAKLFVMTWQMVFCPENTPPTLHNVGTGKTLQSKYAETYKSHRTSRRNFGAITDVHCRKLLDEQMKELGWEYSTELEDGIKNLSMV